MFKKNIGTMDRTIRLVLGAVLIAYAIPLGFKPTGWNYFGWLGLIPIATALFNFCPLYTLLGVNTCKR